MNFILVKISVKTNYERFLTNKPRILHSIKNSSTSCSIHSSCFGILRNNPYGCGNVGNENFRKIDNFIDASHNIYEKVAFIIT